jgi:hypothetical protein
MFPTLMSIWLHVASMAPYRIAPSEAPAFFSDAMTAVSDLHGTTSELALATTFGLCEGGGSKSVVGDGGAAIGTMQLHAEHWRGYGRDEVLADRVLQIELWILSLRDAVEACGSVEAALGRIASGKCGGAKKLVRRRMKGLC